MDAPAFDAIRFVRPALRSIAFCFSVVLISSMTLVKPAHASGTVASINTYFVAGSGFGGYINAATPAAACGDGGSQVTGPVVTQISSSQWQCTYTYVDNGTNFLMWVFYVSPACPVNSTGTVTCTCTDPYVPDSTATSCVPVPVVTCAAPSVSDGAGGCACNPPNRINSIGECTACPVDPLTTPPFSDACSKVLENINSTQAQKDAACGALTDKLKTGMACFRDKLSGISPSIPLSITSDIRSVAYQAHLREVWDKMEILVKKIAKDPALQTACATRRAEFAAEKGCDNAGSCESKSCSAASDNGQRSHCLKGRPADANPNDAQHTQGNAFDVSEDYTINPLQDVLDAGNPQQDIQQFLDAPTNCGLTWGGTFSDNYDPIHFGVRRTAP
jgi:hypothetical protein